MAQNHKVYRKRHQGRPYTFSTEERVKALELRALGFEYGAIADRLKMSRTTIWRLIKGHAVIDIERPKRKLKSVLPEELR